MTAFIAFSEWLPYQLLFCGEQGTTFVKEIFKGESFGVPGGGDSIANTFLKNISFHLSCIEKNSSETELINILWTFWSTVNIFICRDF